MVRGERYLQFAFLYFSQLSLCIYNTLWSLKIFMSVMIFFFPFSSTLKKCCLIYYYSHFNTGSMESGEEKGSSTIFSLCLAFWTDCLKNRLLFWSAFPWYLTMHLRCFSPGPTHVVSFQHSEGLNAVWAGLTELLSYWVSFMCKIIRSLMSYDLEWPSWNE